MNFEYLIGLRYVRTRRRTHAGGGFLSFVAFASMAGVALGVAALIIVMSVMNGFQQELRSRILNVVSHAQIEQSNGRLEDWQKYSAIAHQLPDVVASAPFVEKESLLSFNRQVRGSLVRGVDPQQEGEVSEFAKTLKVGQLSDLQPGEFNIILGVDLARALGVRLGDKVMVVSPKGLVTPAAVMPRVKQFRVVGVFEAGMYKYDVGLALINIQDAQKLYQMDDAVSGVRLKLADLFNATDVAARLNAQFALLPEGVHASDWSKSDPSFFRAVKIEKNVMFCILLLIVAVAMFSIVSALVMTVQDKRADIAILRTLGASPASIMKIFMVQGALMGFIGLLVGATAGVLLALNLPQVMGFVQRVLGFQIFSADVYYIPQIPSLVIWSDVFVIVFSAFVLTILATLYPSWSASRINPAEALRYE